MSLLVRRLLIIPKFEGPRLALERLVPNINWIVVDCGRITGANGSTYNHNWVASNIVDNRGNGFQCTIKRSESTFDTLDLLKLSQQAGNSIHALSHQFYFTAA